MARRPALILVVLAAALVAVGCARMGLDFWAADGATARVLLEIRGVRLGVAMTVGAAFAVAGVLLQALLRNPLAAPDVLGLSSGAGLGVMAVAYAGYQAGQGVAHVGAWSAPAALVGGLGAMALVYALGQRRGLVEPVSLVLVGVVVSILCGSATELLKNLMPDQGAALGRLLIGAIRDVPVARVAWAASAVVAGLGVAMVLARAIDAASLPEDEARSVGVRVGALRLVLFVVAGVLTAAAVVLTGPLGFVGLIAPHVARFAVGPGHRALVPAAALLGATLVVLADACSGLLDTGSGPMPVGILTSVVGGPLLIWLLRREFRGGAGGRAT
jgi:iron complex transport system permease protein